jgi:formylglycine-generating enzyme required for sulfatase activity
MARFVFQTLNRADKNAQGGNRFMKKLLLFLLLTTALASRVTAGMSDVSTFVTDDGKIAIIYTLTADDPENTMPVFAVNFSAEIAGKKPFALKTLEGPGKTGIVIGEGTYTSVWNAAKDCKKEDPSAITVSAEGKDVTDEATYLCLDLKKFKMRYQNDPPDVTKSTCKTKELWLRRIEPGTFTMGSPKDERGREDDETQHEVTLTKAFYIGVFETTQKQFKAIAGYNISHFKGATRPVECVSYYMLRGAKDGSQWPLNYEVDETCSYYGKKKTDEAPTFFYALRSKSGEGLLFDLPTEAQWEYACRAGTTTAWNNGTDITLKGHDLELDKLGCYGYNPRKGHPLQPDAQGYYKFKYKGHAKAGSFQPNAWGLYDMHGNVNEWCLDRYQPSGSDPAMDPAGASFGSTCVLRGGGWHDGARNCRSAYRFSRDPDYGNDYHGFRVVLVQNVFSGPDNQIQKNFEFDIPSGTENTLPVFKVKLYGKMKDGKEYLLEEIGKLEYDGASGIVLGKGPHKLTWTPDVAYTNIADEVELRVDYEDVTSQAKYLVLDLPSNKMRTSTSAPNTSNDKCRVEELWMRRIEPGSFTMGSPSDELGRDSDETQHRVTLTKAYYIGVFEMTQKQCALLADGNPSYYQGETRPVEYVSYNMIRGAGKGSQWPLSYEVDENSVLGRIRKKAGNTFDLPTEAQWEYACRAGTTTALNDGNNITNKYSDGCLAKLARYYYNRNDGKGGYSEHTKVGSYLPNAWGLYDMHGNVWEWCLDWYGKYADAETDPAGASTGSSRVLRGGSWGSDARDCRSAYRYYDYPDGGFRVVLVQNVFSGPDNQIQKNFEFDIPSGTENTLPVFKVKLYGKMKDGKEYLLEEIGKLEYDGASGIVLGKGPHKLTWTPDVAYTNIADEVELRVDYEDVTSQAKYLVLDLPSNKMRTSTSAPNIGSDKCRTEELWLKRIEPGTFTMGSPTDELGRYSNETQHRVTLTKAYYIGVFEMTQKQYELVIRSNPSQYTGDARPVDKVSYNMIRGAGKGSQWPLSYEVDENSVLGRIRKKAGNTFDLPTEAQWEYACRAGTTTALNSGKNLTSTGECQNMDEVGRYYYNKGDGKGGYGEHTKVGSCSPNAWGLYDMHGNVWEWCLDWYQASGSDPATDPAGASLGSYRVLRGGSWYNYANYCRSARRYFSYPDDANYYRGFRVVLVQ